MGGALLPSQFVSGAFEICNDADFVLVAPSILKQEFLQVLLKAERRGIGCRWRSGSHEQGSGGSQFTT